MTTFRFLPHLALLLAFCALNAGTVAPAAAAAVDTRPVVNAASPTVAAAPFECAAVSGIPATECAALVDLYNSTNGPGWANAGGWLQTLTPCEWFGITCIPGHVHVVNLIGNQLAGPIPASIADLTTLQFLFLDHNQLTGPMPAALAQLALLISLELDSNQLSGPLLPELGTLPLLINLDLDDNFFTGSIPAAWGSAPNLRTLDLDNNLLTGSLPVELGNLSQLALLDVHGNQMSGAIPAALGNAAQLVTLDLSGNQFSGVLPVELGNLTRLATLNLSGNQFAGPLPASLQNLTSVSSFAFQGTGLCEPTAAPFQAWLNSIAFVFSTEVPCTVGGRNLKIHTGALDLAWDGGLGQTAYALLRYNASTAVGDLLSLPLTAIDYAETAPDGSLYCYLLAAVDVQTPLGVSDLECAMAGLETGTIPPGAFTLSLNQSMTVTLTWAPPPGGVDGYALVKVPLSGAPGTVTPLGPATTSTTHDTGGVPNCYLLAASRGAEFGITNMLCGMPGFSSLNLGGRLQGLADLAGGAAQALGGTLNAESIRGVAQALAAANR